MKYVSSNYPQSTQFVLLVCQLLIYSCAMPSDRNNHNEWTLYTALEQSLLNDSTGELFRLRGAFFPAMKYQFWKADGLQAIQFHACLTLTDISCQNTTAETESAFGNNTTITRCRSYQWTNSWLLGLLATHQLYQFEPLLTALVYEQFVGHREMDFRVKLNLTDPILCSITETDLEKYFMSFISWTKAYATAKGKPKTWNTDDQGYVSRVYNTYSKGLEDSDLQHSINNTILACFICTNCLLVYLMVLYGGTLYRKASYITTGSSAMKRNACQSILLVAALLAPMYIVGILVGHMNGVYPKYYPPCKDTLPIKCTSYSSSVYKQEVISFYSKIGVLVLALLSYLISASLTVKTIASSRIVFRTRCSRCLEVYLWWMTLFGIHICVGLAGVPILIYLIITPTYTFFFVFAIGLFILLLTVPVVLCLQYCQPEISAPNCTRSERCRTWSVRFFSKFIAYLLVTSVTVLLVYLYYCLLIGGASMNGAKGIFFSLLPPAVVTLSGFYIKIRFFRSTRRENDQARDEPTESDRIINNTEDV